MGAVVGSGLTGTATTAMGTTDVNLVIGDNFENVTNASVDVVYTVTPYIGSCAGTSFTITVTVDPIPSFTSPPSPETICSGDQLNFTPTSPVAGTIFTWTVLAPPEINGETNGTGTIDDILINTSDAIQVVTYTIRATGPGPESCVNPVTEDYIVTVDPIVTQTLTNNELVVCSGESVSIDYETLTENGDITLTAVYPTGSGGDVTYTGQSVGSSGTITEVLSNSTSAPITVTYTFTASANSCPVQVTSVDVVVDPIPGAFAMDQSICSGEITSISITNPNGVAGTVFNWTVVSSTNLTGPVAGTGNLIAQVLNTINPSNPGTVEYEIIPTSNGCDGAAFGVTVDVTPQPIANAGLDMQECDLSANLSAVISTSGGIGTWSKVSGPGNVMFDDNTLPNAAVTVDQFGVYILRWAEDNAGCLDVDDVEIIFTQAPMVLSVDDDGAVFCEPNEINLRGFIGGGATNGVWSLQSGGSGTLSASSLTGSEVTAVYLPAPGEFEPLVFRLTTDDSDGLLGPCIEDFLETNITVNEAAQISAGMDLNVCEDAGSISLMGSIGGSTTLGTWSGGLGSFDNINDPNATYTFDPAEINTTVVLTFTSDDPDGAGPCTVVFDQMELNVNRLPFMDFFDLPAVTDEGAADFEVTGTQVGGTFTISPGSGLANPRIDGLDKVDFQPSSAVLGSNFVTYSYTDGNGCFNSITKEVIVNPVTTINFNIRFAPVDGDGNPIVCANSGRLLLVGAPLASEGLPGTQFFSPVSGIVNQEANGDWTFDTDGLTAGLITVEYTFINTFGVPTELSKPIIVQASPDAQISVLNSCVEDEIEFFDLSTVVGSSVVDWRWDFDDNNTFSEEQNPTHFYSQSGEYTVTLTVTSDQGCSSSTSMDIRVGDTPVPDFNWTSICNGDATEFRDNTDPGSISTVESFTWDFGDGVVISGNAGDNIPPGTNGGRTFGTYDDPFHEYVSTGNYTVTQSVETNDGCTNQVSQTVFILPFNVVMPSAETAYMEDFESGAGGWVATSEVIDNLSDPKVYSDTSWIMGVPNGTTINSPGNNAWWTGRNGGRYFLNEDSYVNGPCFDLSQLSRPMISMDIWVDTQQGFDGVVLQYSTDGGLTWANVGDLVRGVAWYDSEGLNSSPGDSDGNFNEGDQGWSIPTDGWVSARFSLEEIPFVERGFVRFRVAFGSDGSDPPGTNLNGFAFDNVFIGNKQRIVLLEHFTDNGSQVSLDANQRLNDIAQEQLIDATEIDFTTIQYHIDFTGADAFNLDNPNDPSARVTFYGVSEPPITVLDGSIINDLTFDIDEIDIDRRSLQDPQFDIFIENLNTSEEVVSINIAVTANEDFSDQIVVNAAVVEDEVELNGVTYNNILKRLLFGGEGRTVDINWTTGTTQSLTTDWEVDVPIYEPDNLFIVAFVQDKITREIYAAQIIKSPRKVSREITSIPIEIEDQLKDIAIYPNPAKEVVNFKVKGSILENYSWKIVDQRGVTMLEGILNFDSDGIFSLSSSELPNGVYYVVLGVDNKAVIYRKLAIMNRE
ncbi:MAG: PKD-like domain-containing protein [Bacteroidota bacterium]